MLSNNLELILRKSLILATEYKHEYATYEHLLLCLIEDSEIKELLLQKQANVELLQKKLHSYLQNDLISFTDDSFVEAKPTAGFQRVVQRAALHSQARGQKIITAIHVLAEFFFEHDAYALECLEAANLSKRDVIDYIKGTKNSSESKDEPSDNAESKAQISNNTANAPLVAPKLTAEPVAEIESFCLNLNKQALNNSIDHLIGRQAEIQRTIEILCRRRKNNAVLVGEPGVGKTAIAEGLALRIVKNDVPAVLKEAVIYSLDIGKLVAGTKFRGDFEERIKMLLGALQKNPHSILFIDEIHTIIGAGSTSNSAMDASNLLKPALARGEIRCIGATTFKEYYNYFEKDMALVRRFQKVVVEEPNLTASVEILRGLKEYYEQHHNVKYADSALQAAVELSNRFIYNRHLPDKAIDLIDEAGARSKSTAQSTNSKPKTITDKNIEQLLASIINIPTLTALKDEISHLKQLERNLKEHVFGQDEAIGSLCASIKLSKAGLKNQHKPIGCYMLAGPTGVGKTELAKQLAKFNNMQLLKYDMSEYSESNSIAKLLGSAPGYVGFDQGGLLTSQIDKHPYSVVLFDEIEKAHSDIFNLLLQIMDEGKLTDNTGKLINFTHTIILFTTNLVAQKARSPLGFSNKANDASVNQMEMTAFDNHFSPEFQARLDKIILFNPIEKVVDKIVAKNLKVLSEQLAEKNIKLIVDKSVTQHFVKNYAIKGGARMLDRELDRQIRHPLVDEILFGKLKKGGTVTVDYNKKEAQINFKIEGASAPSKTLSTAN